MRIFRIALFVFFLNAGFSAQAAEQVPLGNLAKADFSREFALPAGAQELLGGKAGRLHFATKDGGVVVTGLDGAVLMTLPAKDAKGNVIFKKPRSATIGNGLLYVVDSSLSQVAMFNAKGEYQGSFGAGVDMDDAVGVATHEGIVYVLDKGDKHIQMFGSNGVYINMLELRPASAGKPAKGEEEIHLLRSPTDVQVDARGLIYVLDSDDDLVKVYKPSGEYVKHLPRNGHLASFVVAQDGIYLVDGDGLFVQKYSFDDKPVYRFGSKGKDKAQFKSITGLAVMKDRQVVVSDKAKGVASVFVADAGEALEEVPKFITRRFVQWTGEFPAAVITKLVSDGADLLYGINSDEKEVVRFKNGAVDAQFKLKDVKPVGVALDKSGGVWVLDDKKSRVIKLDDKGNIVSSFGSGGSGAGQFDDPTDIAISASGRIIVSDSGSDKVQIFNGDGIFQNEIAKLDNPLAVSVSPQETLFVLEDGKISIYSPQGEKVGTISKEPDGGEANLDSPKDLLATVDEVMVLDKNRVKVYTHKGKYLRSFAIKGKGRGELIEPVSIAGKDEVTFYIAEEGNKRIQTFVTQYKPSAPQQMVADAGVHAIRLRWADPNLPYIKQYAIYRSKEENSGFVRVATSLRNEYVDRGLEADGKYFYRVGAETALGYEGASSALVNATARKFMPPVVSEIKVEPGSWQLKMTWKPIESDYLSAYRIYQKDGDVFTKVGESVLPEFVKSGLAANSRYTYYISALSKDGLESEKAVVNATTSVFSKAPLEIEIVKLTDIFSNSYKIYEQDGVGVVKLTNNTDKLMEGVKLAFTLKDFMDYATETNVDKLLPGQSVEIPLKAVFNNNILTVTEDSSVQTMLEASYFDNGKPQTFAKNPTIKVYEKHKLMWDQRERFAAFVTPKDPPLVAFTRSVLTQYSEVHDESLLASVMYNALGVLGLTYVKDPSNPYQLSRSGANVVDYVQFPRETLMHKAGDCDDLVAFYSAALESIGIETRVLEVPEHMLMMFSTDIPAEADGWNNDDMYVVYEGKLWIPVETTMVGNKFVAAWEKGAATYYKWAGKGLTILDVRTAWATYKPASLPESKDKQGEVKKADIDKKFPTEFSSMLTISSNAKTHRYREAIEKNPNDAEAYHQVGIVLAKMGDIKGSMKYFDKVISLDPKNAAALNNRGNLYMILDRYAEAEQSYREAATINPEDTYIWINLAKAHRSLGDMKGAKEAFRKAQQMDPGVKKKFKALALELTSTLE